MQFRILISLCTLCLFSCQAQKGELQTLDNIEENGSRKVLLVDFSEVNLIPNQGLVFYKDEPFTGITSEYYPNKQLAETTHWVKGKRDGYRHKWFPSGTLSFEAFYKNGRLDQATRFWWKNGVIKSEARYKDGTLHGIQKQWYASGAIFKESRLVAGKEQGLQKAWRENGKIYNNYEAKNGRIFGLRRSNLCFELEEEKIQLSD